MEQVLYLISTTVSVFLSMLLLFMLVRAVASWFLADEENTFTVILFAVTEPFIFPVRYLCDKFEWFSGWPIDMPFFITYILLAVLSALL